jgi:hypothetical protein
LSDADPLQGAPLAQSDWLADALVTVETDGVRIGVYNGTRGAHCQPRINFHGLTVPCILPSINEKDRCWWARVDIIDSPALQLVLPARTEMVESAALEALRDLVRRTIFRHIASLGSHRLSFAQWTEARISASISLRRRRSCEAGPRRRPISTADARDLA